MDHSDTDSENISLIRRSILDGKKTCNSQGISNEGHVINVISIQPRLRKSASLMKYYQNYYIMGLEIP